MNNKTECVNLEPETKIKIGAITYIVAAHFDEMRENLPDKIRRLLCSEVKTKLTHLRNPGQ